MATRFSEAAAVLNKLGVSEREIIEAVGCTADDLTRWMAGEEAPDDAYDELHMIALTTSLMVSEAVQLSDLERSKKDIVSAASSMSYAQERAFAVFDGPSESFAEVLKRLDLFLDAFRIPHAEYIVAIRNDLERLIAEGAKQ